MGISINKQTRSAPEPNWTRIDQVRETGLYICKDGYYYWIAQNYDREWFFVALWKLEARIPKPSNERMQWAFVKKCDDTITITVSN